MRTYSVLTPCFAMLFLLFTCPESALAKPAYSILISEVLANPQHSADNSGEFIELYNPRELLSQVQYTLIRKYLDNEDPLDTIWTEKLQFDAKEIKVICSDPEINPYSNCSNSTKPKTLLNTKAAKLLLYAEKTLLDSIDYSIPKEGISEERIYSSPPSNTLTLSNIQWQQGNSSVDFCSPGFFSPGSVYFINDSLPTWPNLKITLDSMQQGSNQVYDVNNYTILSDPNFTNDQNLPSMDQTWTTPQLIFLFQDFDLYPLDDSAHFIYQNFPGEFLRIDKVNPCPDESSTEWIELLISGNQGDNNSIDVSHFSWGWKSLDQDKIEVQNLTLASQYISPGKRFILAKDTTLFRKKYGEIRLPLFQPKQWFTLSNTTDTIALYLNQQEIDFVTWGDQSNCTGKILARNSKNLLNTDQLATQDELWLQDEPQKPGLSSRQVQENQIKLYQESFEAETVLNIFVEMYSQSTLELALFSLDGTRVYTQSYSKPGHTKIVLSSSKIDLCGLFILCWHFNSEKWKKTMVRIKDAP